MRNVRKNSDVRYNYLSLQIEDLVNDYDEKRVFSNVIQTMNNGPLFIRRALVFHIFKCERNFYVCIMHILCF